MRYRRLPIEIESPEELGYETIANNLSESSFSDMRLADYDIESDVSGLLLQYGDHRGNPALRAEIASDSTGVGEQDVIVVAGASAALFVIATSLLESGDHILVCRPNYATNIETPMALGADVEFLDLHFEDHWALEPDRIEAALRPRTKLVSLTYPQNPTGQMIDAATLERIVGIVERHPSARLLLDETYRELAYGEPLPVAASLSPRVISVSSVSKTYGMPGLRIGWITCIDTGLMETLLAAKEQILITGATIDEEMASRVLAARSEILPQVRAKIADHLEIVRDWIEGQETFEWVEPTAGVVALPRIHPDIDTDINRFYECLLSEHGTYVGPGHWFDQDRRSFRLGFAWPSTEELRRGLSGLSAAAESSRS